MDLNSLVTPLATLIAAFGGYFLAGMNDQRRDERQASDERELRVSERRAEREQQRHQFQLETLIALQVDVEKMARLTGRALHFDHMQARQGLYTQLPESWSEEMYANSMQVGLLRGRVLDPGLRATVEAFAAKCTYLSMTPSHFEGLEGQALEAEADARLRELSLGAGDTVDAIGDAIRKELTWGSA